MARLKKSWKYWCGAALVVALMVLLTLSWLRQNQRHAAEVKDLARQVEQLSSLRTDEEAHQQNEDLVKFIDESYTLLYEKGIHVQLDLETDPSGRIRLRADSLKLKEELEAKLRELEP